MKAGFSFDERKRYARQLTLAHFGETGQARLRDAHALVVGAGGLGSACATYLAAAGIGALTIVDFDRVDVSNLQRQILHETGDIGRAKVESARDRLEELNPEVTVRIVDARIEDFLATSGALDGIAAVLDGSDRFETRLAVNAACVPAQVPLISAAILGWAGQIGVFAGYRADCPCYQCFVPAVPPDAPTCRTNGILGPIAGLTGSWQALEAIKVVTETGNALFGRLVQIDGLGSRIRESRLAKDPACPVCSR